MKINDILAAIKMEMDEAEDGMEGADSDDFLFCAEKLGTLFNLSNELKKMIMLNKGRTLEEFIQILRGRIDAMCEVINLINWEEKNESAKEND